MTDKKVYFNVFCIDKRFDALTTEYFVNMGYIQNYYLGTTAGAALPLGYKQYCSEICNCNCECVHDVHNVHDNSPSCNPFNTDMILLKDSLIKNIEIALTLDPIYEIYLINHQDCGAIKAFLSCSGYPKTLGENNPLEIEINTNLLLFAKDYINKVFPNINVRLGLMDINGSIADFNHKYYSWNLIYRGYGNNPLGLWYDYKC
jgi:hypothetical protein